MSITLHLTTSATNAEFTQVVSPTTSLEEILIYFETQDEIKCQEAVLQRQHHQKTKFLAYTGIPPKESFGPKDHDEPIVQIQYNIPGLMKPVLSINKHKFSSHEIDFSATPTSVLIEASGESNPTTLDVVLSHVYTADHVSKKAQQDAIASVMNSFSGNAPPATAAKAPAPSANDLPAELAAQLNALAFEDPTLFASTDGMDSQTALVAQINKMLSVVEARFVLDAPKVIVTARIQQPQSKSAPETGKSKDRSVDDEGQIGPHLVTPNAAKLDQGAANKGIDGEKSHIVDDSDVPSEEITDSEDERFYQHNKKDYHVVHRIYTTHRRQLKEKAAKEKKDGQGELPVSLLGMDDDDSDSDVVAAKVQNGTQPSKPPTGSLMKHATKPQSLAELAKQMKAQKGQGQNPSTPAAVTQPFPTTTPSPSAAPTINTSFKSKDGKFAPAALTYRLRMPTIFYPLLSSTQIDPTSPDFIDLTTLPETHLSSPFTAPCPVLVINISIQLQLPSTTTILDLYKQIDQLLSNTVSSEIKQKMGYAPNLSTAGTSKTATTPVSAKPTPLDQFPFILSVAAPPFTQLTSQTVYQLVAQKAKTTSNQLKYPLLLDTTMRDFNIPHRSAFIFHWRQISESGGSKQPINLIHLLSKQTPQQFVDPATILSKDQLRTFLAPILNQVDEVQAQ